MAYPWWVFEKESNRQVRNTRLYARKLGVVPARSNMPFGAVVGKPAALGDLPTTNAGPETFAGAGIAGGFAAATAVAEGTTAAPPYTDATTDGLANGGFITSYDTSHVSIDFPYGPTPVSVSVSTTSVATHRVGEFLSCYSLRVLVSPSVHGLL